MGALGNYYFDGVSFASASMLYTNADLSTVAPNGWPVAVVVVVCVAHAHVFST